jgi:dihydrofolate reductase
MAKLIYVANVSLDGYIEDAQGSFEWTAPIDEVFTFITDLVRPVGTYLYGRRMYETMAVWETQPALAAQSELMADFAPVLVGEGKPAFPRDARIQLELLEERRFANGVVNLRYRVQN